MLLDIRSSSFGRILLGQSSAEETSAPQHMFGWTLFGLGIGHIVRQLPMKLKHYYYYYITKNVCYATFL
jgi:hypothetical protein